MTALRPAHENQALFRLGYLITYLVPYQIDVNFLYLLTSRMTLSSTTLTGMVMDIQLVHYLWIPSSIKYSTCQSMFHEQV